MLWKRNFRLSFHWDFEYIWLGISSFQCYQETSQSESFECDWKRKREQDKTNKKPCNLKTKQTKIKPKIQTTTRTRTRTIRRTRTGTTTPTTRTRRTTRTTTTRTTNQKETQKHAHTHRAQKKTTRDGRGIRSSEPRFPKELCLLAAGNGVKRSVGVLLKEASKCRKIEWLEDSRGGFDWKSIPKKIVKTRILLHFSWKGL